MTRIFVFGALVVWTLSPLQEHHPTSSADAFVSVRRALESARAAGRLRDERTRLTAAGEPASVPGLRAFSAGYAALLEYDHAAAERSLAMSFTQTPSPYTALALATSASHAGQQQRCVDWSTRGLERARDRSLLAVAVELLVTRGECQFRLRDPAANRRDVEAALGLAADAGDRRARALALRALGASQHNASESAAALQSIGEALAIHTEVRDEAAIAEDLLALSYPYQTAHPFAEKIPLLDRALGISRQIRDPGLEGRILMVRGASLMLLNRHTAAYRDYLEADRRLRDTGLTRSRAANSGNLSLLFTELGDYDRAEEQARLAIALYRQAQNPAGVLLSLVGLGDLAKRRHDLDAALAYYRQAEAESRPVGDRVLLRNVLLKIGLAHLSRGAWAEADRVLAESRALADEIGYAPNRAAARAALGDLQRLIGRFPEATNDYQAALDIARGSEAEATIEIHARHGRALILAANSRTDEAIGELRLAIARSEEIRASAVEAGLQTTYFVDKRQIYVDAINILFEAHRAGTAPGALQEAFAVAERAKARTLLDALAAGPTAIPAPHSAADIASTLSANEVLVEFVLGTPYSFVFTLTANGRLSCDRLPSRDVIERSVASFRVLVERRPAIGATMEPLRRVGQQLYDLVLATALARVSSSRRLVIVGDGLLFYLPFAALTRTGESTFLGEQFEIARAPSAAVLATVRTREPAAPRPTDFVGFGDPLIATQDRTDNAALLRALSQSGFSFAPLPGSRLEVLSAARVFGPEARVFTGPDFTGARAIAELQRPHRVVHFATHAVLDERLPHRSGIVVSEDAAGATLLSARELARLRIPVDLVTLSACQTGLGRIVDGEGVLGLAWALTRAGAGSVMVTLWNISDAASSTMIVAFYRALRDGQTKPAALLAARRALIGGSNPELRHPYYWAGYSLIGG